MSKMWKLIIIIVLAICSTDDLRERHINIYILLIGEAVALVWILICHKSSFSLTGIIPGIILLIYSKMTSGLGDGDAYVFIFIGTLLGAYMTIEIMITSFFMSGLYAIYLLLYKKEEKNSGFPFVPFIFIGTVLCLLINFIRKELVLL